MRKPRRDPGTLRGLLRQGVECCADPLVRSWLEALLRGESAASAPARPSPVANLASAPASRRPRRNRPGHDHREG